MAHQIEKKFIKNDAVDGTKVKLLNAQALRARNGADSADIELMKLDATDKIQMHSAPIVGIERTDNKALQTKDQVDAAVAAAVALVTLTPVAQVKHVAKNGNDSTATGGIDKPFLTIKAAQDSITDASASKRYVIKIWPGTYVENDSWALKDHVIYVGEGSSSAVVVQHATLATPIVGAMTTTSRMVMMNFFLNSPLALTQTAGSVSRFESYHMVFGAETTISVAGTGPATRLDMFPRYSRFFGNVTSDGPAQLLAYFCQFGSAVTFGAATPTTDQGFCGIFHADSNVGATVTVNGASLTLVAAAFDNVNFDTKGFPNNLVHDAVSINNLGTFTGAGATRIRLNPVSNLRYTPSVNGNWNVVPAEPKAALDELAARVKFVETNSGASSLSYSPADGTDWVDPDPTTIAGGLDQLADRVTSQEAGLASANAEIAALAAGLEWRPSAFLISEDAELQAAVEGDTLSSILPFLDDESPSLVIGDFSAGMYLIAKNGASSKVMKVIDDAGTLKVSFVGVEALAANQAFVVVNDLTDSPAARENNSIWSFDGSDMVKLGDFDWGLASGINLSSGYAAAAGTVGAGDSVETAISKLDGNVQAEAARALAAEGALDGRLDTLEGQNLDARLDDLEAVANYKSFVALSSTDISNGFYDLGHEIKDGSLDLHVGRLALFEGEDYNLSVVGGVTRVTFINSIAVGGDEALEEGMYLGIKYQA